MCGRYAIFTDRGELKAYYEAEAEGFEAFEPVYNAAPSMLLPVVLQRNGSRHLELLRWGLIPHWSKDANIGYKMINARAETVDSKPAYRKAFQSQRCLIPANGFFEWKKEQQGKQPHFIRASNAALLTFAGLYDEWMSPDGEIITSYTILTTEANNDLQELHHRMPVILPPDYFELWLALANRQTVQLKSLLAPRPDGELTQHPVTREVNSPRNQGPELLERVN